MPNELTITSERGTRLHLEKSVVNPGGLYAYLADVGADNQVLIGISGHFSKRDIHTLRDWLNTAYPPPPDDNVLSDGFKQGYRAGATAVAKAIGQMLAYEAASASCSPDELLISGFRIAQAVEAGTRNTGGLL